MLSSHAHRTWDEQDKDWGSLAPPLLPNTVMGYRESDLHPAAWKALLPALQSPKAAETPKSSTCLLAGSGAAVSSCLWHHAVLQGDAAGCPGMWAFGVLRVSAG